MDLTIREKTDLIEIFKVLNCNEPIVWCSPPKPTFCNGPASGIRENTPRLTRESFKSDRNNKFSYAVSLRHRFFVNRVVPHWNGLPSSVSDSRSVSAFKAAYDNYKKRLL